MGTVALGAVDGPIDPTLTAPQISYILNDSGSKVVVVSNALQLAKVLKIQQQAKSLERITLMGEKLEQQTTITLTIAEVFEIGGQFEKSHSTFSAGVLARVRPQHLLTLTYASGTAGNPKGAMLTHKNLCSNIKSVAQVSPLGPTDTLLSFLPLCHSFERMTEYYTAMSCGCTVAYAESAEAVRYNLLEVRPTVVTTVPRLFERICSRIMKQVDSSSPARRRILHWVISVGREFARLRKQHEVSPLISVQSALG